MGDLTNASPTQTQTASPVTGTDPVSSGPIQQAGEAGQSATGSENFIPQGIDVNTLPPAVRAELDRINKEMVRGFTAKTQKLAEDQKKYEGFDGFKQKADLYEQFSSNPEFVKNWNEYVQKQNGQQQAASVDPNDELKTRIKEVEQKLQEADIDEMVDGFREAKNEKGEALNPDFGALNEINIGKGVNGDEYSLLRACIELSEGKSPQEKLANGYKSAKQIRDQILEEGRKQGMGKMLSRVRNSTEAPTITSDKGAFNGDAKKLSVREARELAEKGIVAR